MSLLKSLAKVGGWTSILSSPSRMNHAMFGPWFASGTSSPLAFFGLAVTYPRHPRGRILSPFLGTATPRPQLMPKNPTRMLSMRLAGRFDGAGEAEGDGDGDGDGDGAGEGDGDGSGTGDGEGIGVARGDGAGSTGETTTGLGLGVGMGRGDADGVGDGLMGVPPWGWLPTRMRPGRVGNSSVTVQPMAESTANPANQWDILMGTSLEIT